MLIEGVKLSNGAVLPLAVDDDGKLLISGVTITGDVTIGSEVEVKNDSGSPVPVSGPLTDTELRATAVPVSGPLTDTELRATAVPVSGTVSSKAGSLTALGYQQITSLSSAALLTVPVGATAALIQSETKGVRWRDDGETPTASVGMSLGAGETILFTGDLAAFQVIEVEASAKLNVSYYS